MAWLLAHPRDMSRLRRRADS